MELMRFGRWVLVGILTLALAACSTTQAQLEKNPKAISKSALCRSYVDTKDMGFKRGLTKELKKRAIDPASCFDVVKKQDEAAVALAAIAIIGATVAICANGNCGGGYYQPTYPGNCRYNWQRDARGNLCGNRSASARPGGY